jgi:two-component system, chemotaxis family, protein-glutamate methylesterase/glutaminase
MADDEFSLDRPSAITCPECEGALFPGEPQPHLVFRCHIGHQFVWTSMLEAHQARIEATLGTAMVLMKERAEICRELLAHHQADEEALDKMIAEAIARAEIVKALLQRPWSFKLSLRGFEMPKQS